MDVRSVLVFLTALVLQYVLMRCCLILNFDDSAAIYSGLGQAYGLVKSKIGSFGQLA